ncbi:MAG TPA: hypothetical protein VF182_14720 [Candidatus Binatia bacterium]
MRFVHVGWFGGFYIEFCFIVIVDLVNEHSQATVAASWPRTYGAHPAAAIHVQLAGVDKNESDWVYVPGVTSILPNSQATRLEKLRREFKNRGTGLRRGRSKAEREITTDFSGSEARTAWGSKRDRHRYLRRTYREKSPPAERHGL